jgi:quinolinate synthase
MTAFPSLVIGAGGYSASGAFAEAQASFLEPDPAEVSELTRLLTDKNAGVVAHFYMDPELQGVLSASSWPFIHISDSLLMADSAVKMAKDGAKTIVVLGVDFMSENVRAVLDAAGFSHVPVYRVDQRPIGCSLAESAESPAYGAYLTRAAQTPASLHVIYINTSLRTKAHAEALVPTITCTSSNVVKTVLTAFHQIPELTLWFGPDTYMGRNLKELFGSLLELPEEKIRALHSRHDRRSIARLLPKFHYFEQGTCIVHQLFGDEVARRVRSEYADCFVTAHLEVPGEMFRIALEAQRHDAGAVGSTSDILGFIGRKVDQAVERGEPARLRFVLGTEAGMVTSIARRVKKSLVELRDRGGPPIEAEIVFPVASEAIAVTGQRDLALVPGVAGGEGCSTEGGCATCPYMKMNSLDALFAVLRRVDTEPRPHLVGFEPKKYEEPVDGHTVAELGGVPILRMRELSASGRLAESLVRDVRTRGARVTHENA